MHVLTIQTKFTFGDRVRFDSRAQYRRGQGTMFAITVDIEGQIDCIIAIDGKQFGRLQPGILEDEITLQE